MLNASAVSMCKSCQPLFHGSVFLEEQKEEEKNCSYCYNVPATLLFSGQPSCYSCFKIQKSQKVLRTQHAIKRSQDYKSLSPKKGSVRLEKNENIQSLRLIHPLDKAGSIPRIMTLRSQEEISKDRSPKDLTRTKQKSLFRTAITQEIPSVTLPKNSLNCFIENLSKKGLDFSSAIFHAKEGSFSSKGFHENCDHKENLAVIIVFSSGYILGTFQELPLNPGQNLISDDRAVIFSVFGGEKVFYYDISSRKLKYEPSGLSFGVPTGLLINLDVIDESFCALELKYKSPLGGDVKFKIAENFVWSLIVKEVLAFKLS